MAKYIPNFIEIEAYQWFKNGDHPNDHCRLIKDKDGNFFLSGGKVVRHYNNPFFSSKHDCPYCGFQMQVHGWIDQGSTGFTVCPGDYIITDSFKSGIYYPVHMIVFESLYYKLKEK